MHHSKRILILPNAWDVPSARIFEEASFRAIATTSGGVSVSLGYPDGERISRQEMLEAVGRIAKSVLVPVSADMEAGFSQDVEGIADTAKGLISSGAIGLNIEDVIRENGSRVLVDKKTQMKKIETIRRIGDSIGIHIVINARTDAFRFAPGDKLERLEEIVVRANAYKEAGADCIFPFGVSDAQSISTLVEKIETPINIRAGGVAPTIPELEKLGVARASLATGPICATLGLLKIIAYEVKEKGTYESLTSGAITHDELNSLAVPRKI